ncbi:MAG: septal ring lytic transglycosylase RlpA family protein, partial [Actinomycetota bacterium]|nr:septal ring lytic transglycosylase RlpA family protein [Actinomycetota bacterium]
AEVARSTRRALQGARSRQAHTLEELAGAREDLHQVQQRLEERVRQMYVNGDQAAMALLLSLGSLDDVEPAVEYLSQVAGVDARLLDDLRARREEVERLREESYRAVAAAEAANLETEEEYQRMKAVYQSTLAEAEVLERRIENLEQAWSRYRLELARQVVADVEPSPMLLQETLAQAELRASLPLGPADGAPPGLRRTGEVFEAVSSWYGPGFHGRRASSGAIFDERDFTAAHRTLPHGTLLLVTYRGRQVVVMVNDRGPFIEGRQLDLSREAAEYLGLGVGKVVAEILVPIK